MNRSSGILLPISSLPSPYGIGTFWSGSICFLLIFCMRQGRNTGSFYHWGLPVMGIRLTRVFSTFAKSVFCASGSFDEDGLLLAEEVEACDWGEDPRHVDYGKIFTKAALPYWQKAKARGYARDYEDVQAFCQENEQWLDNYALYMACKSILA